MTLRTLFDRGALGAALLAAACASTTVLAADKVAVPFKAAFTISEYVAFGGSGGCMATGTITGTGQASHLGQTTLASQDCIIFVSATAFHFTSNNVVLQAANGDQLRATYNGIAEPQPGGALLLSGTFSLIGGTGRFAGATGSGSLEGMEDISTFPARGVVMMSGRISY